KKLNLSNLFITISGYMPERGANFSTCSFKETEAYSVCGRIDPANKQILVVASAGNTARAFAKVCSDNNIKLLLCVPEDNIDALWFNEPLNDCVKLIVSEKGADYFDAIHLGNIAVESPMFYAEGGAKNIARRDGMGTTYLSAATFIGSLPDYYFQAIGSGTGAIAAWEANMRMIADGRFGNTKTKLILSQNAPFLVMYNAWEKKSRALLPLSDNDARKAVEEIDAKVLSNRKPPYSITGGVFDALTYSEGDIKKISNSDSAAAAKLFEQTEGIDIHPAAAVAVASLIEAVEKGEINRDKTIMINITGAGSERYAREHKLIYLKPSAVFPMNPDKDSVIKTIEKLY
ncbi:MAG: cysteate synthase, partial [Rikenellaceae bacterium]